MANLISEQPSGTALSNLIDGDFSIDFAVPLPACGGGQSAFATRSMRLGAGFMAVQVEAGWPARAHLLTVLASLSIANVLMPLAHGLALMPSGETGYFVICPMAPGRPLSAELQPWPERALLDLLLRPTAQALVELHGRDVTHRAIRPDNLFRGGATDPVTLGCAWAAPPACRQPCLYEPPYVALCLPAGRGDGVPADDIYALGVTLVTLALGQEPIRGMDPEAMIRSKLDLGSFDAIVGRHRLPNAIAELARGMLADDPEHRPSAQLLGDPAAARARRAAARPQRRGQRSFAIGDQTAETTRELALAVIARPDLAAPQLRNGALSLWVRRALGDATMASGIDDAAALRGDAGPADESRADALLATRAIAILDPLAPLSWRRLSLWPDGLGAALNQALHSDLSQASVIAEIAAGDVPLAFGQLRRSRTDIGSLEAASRLIKTCLGARPIEQGMLRLNYVLNALAPCQSPLLAGRWVARLGDLLPAMELAASGPLRATLPPMDKHVIAFISARRDERSPPDLGQLVNQVAPGDPLSHLRVLARLQQATHPGKLPALTAWMAEFVSPAAARFHSHAARIKLAERLAELGKGGLLPPIVAVLDDASKLAADDQAYQAAMMRGAQIDAELAAVGSSPRRAGAIKLAHEVTSGIGLAACGLALAGAAFL